MPCRSRGMTSDNLTKDPRSASASAGCSPMYHHQSQASRMHTAYAFCRPEARRCSKAVGWHLHGYTCFARRSAAEGTCVCARHCRWGNEEASSPISRSLHLLCVCASRSVSLAAGSAHFQFSNTKVGSLPPCQSCRLMDYAKSFGSHRKLGV